MEYPFYMFHCLDNMLTVFDSGSEMSELTSIETVIFEYKKKKIRVKYFQ